MAPLTESGFGRRLRQGVMTVASGLFLIALTTAVTCVFTLYISDAITRTTIQGVIKNIETMTANVQKNTDVLGTLNATLAALKTQIEFFGRVSEAGFKSSAERQEKLEARIMRIGESVASLTTAQHNLEETVREMKIAR